MYRHLPLSLAIAVCLLSACAQPARQASGNQRDGEADLRPIGLEEAEPTALAEPPVPPAAPPPPPAPMALEGTYDRAMRQSAPIDSVQVAGSRIIAPIGDAQPTNTETYADIKDNRILRTDEQPVSTFSIDVDTGSYANVRRMLNAGQLPPADAVRAEELINYFDYGYAPPADPSTPFSVTTEVAPSPWNPKRHLLLVGLKGYEVPKAQIPAANIVFLVDTSGSMESPDKLELLRQSFKLMAAQLRPQDRVAIVAYAGSAGLVLPSTPGDERATITSALDRLQAGGSTNGGAGIELAYAVAQQHFVDGGVNRVILASDGDFNVGTVSVDALTTLVADKRKSGVGLTVLGFGGGNLNDHMAEQLANTGNGNYFYVDTLNEGRKVLVDQLASTVLTIAQDVKIQVEFNPAQVEEYRLIGYENRMLEREDFNNDRVDAGEIGAGHNVTALYEVSLAGSGAAASDPLRYGGRSAPVAGGSDELAFVRLRYKAPGQDRSQLIEVPLPRSAIAAQASERLRFAAAVAGFADALRGGSHLADWRLADIGTLAGSAKGRDADGYRTEFQNLVALAEALSAQASTVGIAR